MFRLEFRDVRRTLTRSQKWTGSRQERSGSKTQTREHFYSASDKAVCYLFYGLGGLRLMGYAMVPA